MLLGLSDRALARFVSAKRSPMMADVRIRHRTATSAKTNGLYGYMNSRAILGFMRSFIQLESPNGTGVLNVHLPPTASAETFEGMRTKLALCLPCRAAPNF